MTRTCRIAGFLTAVAVLAVVWGPFFLEVLHEAPYGSHAWKQGDRFAMAQRFLEDDNWDILDPRTQSLIPVDARVNAELPVVPYLAAAVARLTGKENLGLAFRIFSLLFSSLAPLGIFLFVRARTGSFAAGVLPMVFLASCPLLAYYATGFHPDAAALGPLLAGMFLALWAVEDADSTVYFALGVALMTLGGLMKMSMAPYLAVPALVVLQPARRTGRRGSLLRSIVGLPTRVLVALGLSGGLLIGQYAYLKVKAKACSPTMFTASIHPFTSLDHLEQVVTRATRLWLQDLFTPPQLVVLSMALVILVTARRDPDRRIDGIALASMVAAAVMVVLFGIFGAQFEWHDYYAIAAFYPLASLLVAKLVLEPWEARSSTPTGGSGRVMAALFLGLAVMVALPLGPRLDRRATDWWRNRTLWLQQARTALDACGGPCMGAVGVLGSQAPNLSLTYLDRQGYVLGESIGTGWGLPTLVHMADVVRYLDARGVRVLVIRGRLMEALGPDRVERWYRRAAGNEGAVVLLRREAGSGRGGEETKSVRTRGPGVPRPGSSVP